MGEEAPQGLHDPKTRATFFLPLNDNREERVVFDVIRYLQKQRERRIPVTGFTYSMLNDPVFTGVWWEGNQWLSEGVVLFIVDYALSLDDRRLSIILGRLKERVFCPPPRKGTFQGLSSYLAEFAFRELC